MCSVHHVNQQTFQMTGQWSLFANEKTRGWSPLTDVNFAQTSLAHRTGHKMSFAMKLPQSIAYTNLLAVRMMSEDIVYCIKFRWICQMHTPPWVFYEFILRITHHVQHTHDCRIADAGPTVDQVEDSRWLFRYKRIYHTDSTRVTKHLSCMCSTWWFLRYPVN